MGAPPSSNKSDTLSQKTAEAHRLYALLVPQSQGNIQVIVPPHELPKLRAQYDKVCAELAALQQDQKEARAKSEEWMKDVREAIPAMLPMLPDQWRPRMEALANMQPGKARDDELRAVLNELVNSEAVKRLGPMGVLLRPMLQKFLRSK